MKKLQNMNPATRTNFLTYAAVILVFAVLQPMSMAGKLSPTLQGQLVPVCAYVVMALSLNLTVGVLGELSLGHAGFMSVGAFTGVIASTCFQSLIPFAPLRLALGMAAGAACAWHGGSLIVGNLLGGDRLWQMLAVLYAAGLLAVFADWLAGLEMKGGKRRDMV